MNQVYTYNKIIPETTTTISENEFKLKSDNKFIKWLINILLKYKMIENTIIKQTKYNRVTLDFNRVSDLLDNLIIEKMIRKFQNNQEFYIVIGLNYFEQLKVECYEQVKFMIPMTLNNKDVYYKGNVMVVMEPGIDGVFLLDK